MKKDRDSDDSNVDLKPSQHTIRFQPQHWKFIQERAGALGISKSKVLGGLVEEASSQESMTMTLVSDLPEDVWSKGEEQRVWIVATSLKPLAIASGLSLHLNKHPASDCHFIFPKSVQSSSLGGILQECQDNLPPRSLDGLFVDGRNITLQFMVIFSQGIYSSFIFASNLNLSSESEFFAKHLLKLFYNLWEEHSD